METWLSADHLSLDVEGVLWLWLDPGFRRLGPIDELDRDCAAGQGRPFDYLEGHWRDASPRAWDTAALEADYRRGCGF